MKQLFTTTIATILSTLVNYAQEVDTLKNDSDSLLIEKSKFQQQPGLALAASKIFFSDKRWSLSGFGEYNYVPLQQNVNTDLGDLELYYSGLYRQSLFFGYRITDKLIWNSELQIEFLHHKNKESHHEIMIEAFVDYLFKDYLKARLGFYPLTIGYVNNNDEPIMFYSVNRSEVERLITPTTWIELGVMLYGKIYKNWSYAVGFSQGLNSERYRSESWIRQGRHINLNVPQSLSINPQINYNGIKNLSLSASGYYGNSGQGHSLDIGNQLTGIKGRVTLTTAYAKYDFKNFRFVTVGTYGTLGDTDKIYELTKDENGINGQVLGNKTYGYLFELGCDILPYIRNKKHSNQNKKTFLYDPQEMKLSLFSRFERLNTHQAIHQSLTNYPRLQSDMNILTLGINFNTKENIVVKANYQFRKNNSKLDPTPYKNIVETGIGFIF